MKYTQEIILAAAILFAIVVAMVLKGCLSGVRKPNGKRGGLVSLQIMVATAICVIAGLVFKNPVLVGCSILLTLFLVKSKHSCNQYAVWQIILSLLLGGGIAFGVIHVAGQGFGSFNSEPTEHVREYMEKPVSAKDDRAMADEMPELSLDGE